MRRLVIAPTGSQSAVRVDQIDRNARLFSEVINGGLSAENLANATKFAIGTSPGNVENAIADNSGVALFGGAFSKRFPASDLPRILFGPMPATARVAGLCFVGMRAAADPNAFTGAMWISPNDGGPLVSCQARRVSPAALSLVGATGDEWWCLAARFASGIEVTTGHTLTLDFTSSADYPSKAWAQVSVKMRCVT